MKANERHKEDRKGYKDNVHISKKTMDKYKQRAELASKKKQLNQKQRKQVEENLRKKHKKKSRTSEERKAEEQMIMEETIDSMQQDAIEIDEIKNEAEECDVCNIIHSAKMLRLAGNISEKQRNKQEDAKKK